MPEIAVLDSFIHFEETGTGRPLVLLHGNPGSSHTWRNVTPGLGAGRILAPDLIGMGGSGQPDMDYSFAESARYLDAWFDALGLEDVVLVGHDWGGSLGFDWASRHPDRVRGIAFFETIIKPIEWAELSPPARQRSELVNSPAAEEQLLNEDVLVRMAFTGGGVLTPVSEADLQPYLAPYSTRASRRPLLAWARQIPIGGEPADVVARVEAYDKWLATSADVPKLLITFAGSPTLLIGTDTARWCAENIAALDTNVVAATAGHHATEDRPLEIAAAVSAWLDEHQLR